MLHFVRSVETLSYGEEALQDQHCGYEDSSRCSGAAAFPDAELPQARLAIVVDSVSVSFTITSMMCSEILASGSKSLRCKIWRRSFRAKWMTIRRQQWLLWVMGHQDVLQSYVTCIFLASFFVPPIFLASIIIATPLSLSLFSSCSVFLACSPYNFCCCSFRRIHSIHNSYAMGLLTLHV